MAALFNTAGHYIFILWFLLLSSMFLAYSQQSEIGCLPYFHTCGLSANLECRSEMCCMRLAEKYRTQKIAKNAKKNRKNIDLSSKSNPLLRRRRKNIKSRRTFNKNSCDLLTAITHTKILVAYFHDL